MTEPKAPDGPESPDKLREREAEERFNKLVGKLVRTPPKPHKPKVGAGKPKPPKLARAHSHKSR